MTAMLLALSLAPAADPPPAAADLQGVWRLTSTDSFGRVQDARDSSDLTALVVAGDKCVMFPRVGTIAVDPGKKTLDLTLTAGLLRGMAVRGRYERIGDTLKVALGTPTYGPGGRPVELKSTPDGTVDVYSYERDKTITPEQAPATLMERAAQWDKRRDPFGGGGKTVYPTPIAAAAGDDPVRALTVRRHNTLVSVLEMELRRVEAGTFTASDMMGLYHLFRSLTALQAELHSDHRRRSESLEGLLSVAKEFEEYQRERVRIGQERPQVALAAEAERLGIEVRVLKAKQALKP